MKELKNGLKHKQEFDRRPISDYHAVVMELGGSSLIDHILSGRRELHQLHGAAEFAARTKKKLESRLL